MSHMIPTLCFDVFYRLDKIEWEEITQATIFLCTGANAESKTTLLFNTFYYSQKQHILLFSLTQYYSKTAYGAI